MKILNYLSAFKLKVSSAITVMLPDIKTIEKLMFLQHFGMHPLGVGGMHIWGAGLLTMFSKICVAVYKAAAGVEWPRPIKAVNIVKVLNPGRLNS